MFGNPLNRINDDTCMSILLVASGFSVTLCLMCSCLCECVFVHQLFCTLADLLPLLSVILHLFLTFSPSLFPYLILSELSGLEWERLEDTEWRNLLRTREVLMVTKNVRDTHLHTVNWHKLAHIFHPLMFKRTSTQTHTYTHTVVLIKALSVSREICNPDI